MSVFPDCQTLVPIVRIELTLTIKGGEGELMFALVL